MEVNDEDKGDERESEVRIVDEIQEKGRIVASTPKRVLRERKIKIGNEKKIKKERAKNKKESDVMKRYLEKAKAGKMREGEDDVEQVEGGSGIEMLFEGCEEEGDMGIESSDKENLEGEELKEDENEVENTVLWEADEDGENGEGNKTIKSVAYSQNERTVRMAPLPERLYTSEFLIGLTNCY